jgi:RNA polymerase sigma-70 factor, ECF subfamily
MPVASSLCTPWREPDSRTRGSMQELVLTQPGKLIEAASPRAAGKADSQRELELLLADSAPLAYRVALGVLRNPAEAEDVSQEALLRAYRRFHGLRDARRFRGWLVRISFRLALDRLRSLRRRADRETRWAQPELRPPPQSAEQLAAANQFEEKLARALDQLPDRLRLVMLLTALEGNTVEETAALLGVPVGTVKSRLFKARKCLMEMLR